MMSFYLSYSLYVVYVRRKLSNWDNEEQISVYIVHNVFIYQMNVSPIYYRLKQSFFIYFLFITVFATDLSYSDAKIVILV